MKGSEKLFEIYTYFPTLHGARIRNIAINYEEKSLALTVDYCDFIKTPGDEIATRFTICWRNIRRADFDWYGRDLYRMNFSKDGDFIKTTFEFGFNGELISNEIEITNIEIEPEEDTMGEGDGIKFLIR